MAKQIKNQIISDYYTLKELTQSSTATRLMIANIPDGEVINNLQYGVSMILDPLRRKLQKPVIVTSGYRCEALNRAVGGVPNSWHTRGNAVDIKVKSEDEAREIFDILKTLPSIDTVLFEHSKSAQWIHIQWDMRRTPRHHYNFNYKAK